MQITLNLDDELARRLHEEARKRGISFGEAINQLLQLGLTVEKDQLRKPFVVVPIKLGVPAGASYDKVEDLLDSLEGPFRR